MSPLVLQLPWEVLAVTLPLAGALLSALWPARGPFIGLSGAGATALAVAGLGAALALEGVRRHRLGGWGAPLGIDLHADGLSLLMLAATALVGLGVSVHAAAGFPPGGQRHFWPLWLFLWAALNALFLAADLFNLYVTLELLGLAAVALVALGGTPPPLAGAMRYLLVSLLGSLAYLLGVALLYHQFGTLDMALLSQRMTPTTAGAWALGLMSAGLLLKAALFPLHFWLPPAHAAAPAPASALLSALVVKGAFYILARLWLEVFSATGTPPAWLLTLLGTAAVLWGGVQALRQERVKKMIAYSTVAQLGYLFMAFGLGGRLAWQGAFYLLLAHALAKSALFLAAGNLLRFGGHDRIADLDRVAQRLPLTLWAFGLAGVSLMGLPPSGGFVGKWLLLEAALEQGQWWLVATLLAGGLLAAAYVFRVVGFAFTQADHSHEAGRVPAAQEWAALALAAGAIALGFAAPAVLGLLEIGSPFHGAAHP